MGTAEVEAFLTSLAVGGRVAASTQNQAMAALLFLDQHILETPLGSIDAPRPKRLPVVLLRHTAFRVASCPGAARSGRM